MSPMFSQIKNSRYICILTGQKILVYLENVEMVDVPGYTYLNKTFST
jgi:hypothetical protein